MRAPADGLPPTHSRQAGPRVQMTCSGSSAAQQSNRRGNPRQRRGRWSGEAACRRARCVAGAAPPGRRAPGCQLAGRGLQGAHRGMVDAPCQRGAAQEHSAARAAPDPQGSAMAHCAGSDLALVLRHCGIRQDGVHSHREPRVAAHTSRLVSGWRSVQAGGILDKCRRNVARKVCRWHDGLPHVSAAGARPGAAAPSRRGAAADTEVASIYRVQPSGRGDSEVKMWCTLGEKMIQ